MLARHPKGVISWEERLRDQICVEELLSPRRSDGHEVGGEWGAFDLHWREAPLKLHGEFSHKAGSELLSSHEQSHLRRSFCIRGKFNC